MSEINSLALRYTETSSEVMQLATKIARDAHEQRQKALDKVASVVGQLKKAGLVDAHEEKIASDQLSDPAAALDILSNVASEYSKLLAKKASESLGRPEQPTTTAPQGSSHSKNANYCGYQRGLGEVSARDRALLALIDRR
jgi:hypothetical protein